MRVTLAVGAQNRLHLVLEMKLFLFQGDFFHLFGLGEEDEA